ncbi:UDP-glucuronosyltransferase 3A1 [Drosophila sechellia]|uniref:GM14618 n=1 Tax=Drosophila sechellia TaxID=7238 RepID=B4HTY8_DROSE|nr:UDP-glucuronosyltransferase 3A1 [Drosophila sechellia]EDW50409.1 GM14618 [Drosophila sechellia]
MRALCLLPVFMLLGRFCSLEAANILCLVSTAKHNNPGWSKPLFDALLANGHSLLVISTAPNPEPKKQVDGLVYFHLPNEYDVMKRHFLLEEPREYMNMVTLNQLLVWYEVLLGSCRALLNSDTMSSKMPELRAQLCMEYDLIITDVTQGIECFMDLVSGWRSKPVLGLSAGKLTPDLMSLLRAENTINAARIPHYTSPVPKNMGFLNRLHNHIMYYAEPLIHLVVTRPVLSQLMKAENGFPNLQLVLLNTHPTLDYVQNLPPGVIEVGGLHIKKQTSPLPGYIQEFTEKFVDGIVYINMPYIEYMNGQGLKAMYTMIHENPSVAFIWNVEQLEQLPAKKPNLLMLHVNQSLQQDILAMRYVKGFLNHGDSFSLQEAIHYGVPVVVLPLKLEEFNNAQRVMERNLGVMLQAKEFNQSSLSDALTRILDEERFTSALYQAQLKFRTRPQSALELAVWHVEQLIAEPRLFKHFAQTEALAQNFCVTNSLDVLTVPLIVLLAAVVSLANLVYVLYTGGSKGQRSFEKTLPKKPKKSKKSSKADKVPMNVTLKLETTELIDDLNDEILEGEEQLLKGEEKPLEVKKED